MVYWLLKIATESGLAMLPEALRHPFGTNASPRDIVRAGLVQVLEGHRVFHPLNGDAVGHAASRYFSDGLNEIQASRTRSFLWQCRNYSRSYQHAYRVRPLRLR